MNKPDAQIWLWNLEIPVFYMQVCGKLSAVRIAWKVVARAVDYIKVQTVGKHGCHFLVKKACLKGFGEL